MNSKQRRTAKRKRPAPGTRVYVTDDVNTFIGLITGKQHFCPPTRVRAYYDNGQYMTWKDIPLDKLRTVPEHDKSGPYVLKLARESGLIVTA
jgi:hypothetical protein